MMDWHRLSLLLEMINNGDSNHSSDSVLLRHTPVAYCAWHILKSKFKWKYDTTNKICWDVTFLSLFSCCDNPVFVFWLGLGKVQWLGSVKYFKIPVFCHRKYSWILLWCRIKNIQWFNPPPPCVSLTHQHIRRHPCKDIDENLLIWAHTVLMQHMLSWSITYFLLDVSVRGALRGWEAC